jgi:hypothetical protein
VVVEQAAEHWCLRNVNLGYVGVGAQYLARQPDPLAYVQADKFASKKIN